MRCTSSKPGSRVFIELNEHPVGFEPSAALGEFPDLLCHPDALAGEFLPFFEELAVVQDIADAEVLQIRELAIERGSLGFKGLLLLREDFLILGGKAPKALHLEVVELRGQRGLLHELCHLPFEALSGDRALRAIIVGTPPGAVIVGVVSSPAVRFVLRGHHEAAFVAADHAGVGEVIGLPFWLARPSEAFLHALELGEGYHCLMLPGMGLTLPLDDSCVERVLEDLVDRALREGGAADPFACLRSEAPLLFRHLPDLAGIRFAREHEAPHPLDRVKALRIWDDLARLPVIQIAGGGHVREPSLFHLGAHAATDVLGEGVHVILGVPEDDREHELALRVVFEGEGSELQIFELPLVEEVDDPAAVYGVPSQAIRVPSDNAFRLALLNPS